MKERKKCAREKERVYHQFINRMHTYTLLICLLKIHFVNKLTHFLYIFLVFLVLRNFNDVKFFDDTFDNIVLLTKKRRYLNEKEEIHLKHNLK